VRFVPRAAGASGAARAPVYTHLKPLPLAPFSSTLATPPAPRPAPPQRRRRHPPTAAAAAAVIPHPGGLALLASPPASPFLSTPLLFADTARPARALPPVDLTLTPHPGAPAAAAAGFRHAAQQHPASTHQPRGPAGTGSTPAPLCTVQTAAMRLCAHARAMRCRALHRQNPAHSHELPPPTHSQPNATRPRRRLTDPAPQALGCQPTAPLAPPVPYPVAAPARHRMHLPASQHAVPALLMLCLRPGGRPGPRSRAPPAHWLGPPPRGGAARRGRGAAHPSLRCRARAVRPARRLGPRPATNPSGHSAAPTKEPPPPHTHRATPPPARSGVPARPAAAALPTRTPRTPGTRVKRAALLTAGGGGGGRVRAGRGGRRAASATRRRRPRRRAPLGAGLAWRIPLRFRHRFTPAARPTRAPRHKPRSPPPTRTPCRLVRPGRTP
jgi:hypothetical protein